MVEDLENPGHALLVQKFELDVIQEVTDIELGFLFQVCSKQKFLYFFKESLGGQEILVEFVFEAF